MRENEETAAATLAMGMILGQGGDQSCGWLLADRELGFVSCLAHGDDKSGSCHHFEQLQETGTNFGHLI